MLFECVRSANKSASSKGPAFSNGEIRLDAFDAAISQASPAAAHRTPSTPLRHEPFPDVSVWYVWHTGSGKRDIDRHVLTQADFEEFSRIKHAHVRERSLATRAALRNALSRAVSEAVKPREWVFMRDANGKPALAPGFPKLYFSCSHTHSASVIAVSQRHPVGVDIESSFLTFDDPHLLEEYFNQRERQAIERLPEHRRAMARVRLWTLKEAVAKMLGTGLALDVSQLEFDAEKDVLNTSCETNIEITNMRLATWSFINQPQPLSVALAVYH